MLQMVKVFFNRYPADGDRNADKETVFEECMPRSEYDIRKGELDALYHNARKIDSVPVMVHERIECVCKLTDEVTVIYSGVYDFDSKDNGRRRRAGRRLCRFLETVNDTHCYRYVAANEFLKSGYYYNYCLMFADRFQDGEKELYLNRKVSGRKASITRSLNRAKGLRKQCPDTLMPDEYKEDPRFRSILLGLRSKRDKLRMIMNVSVESLPDLVHEADLFIANVYLRNDAGLI